MKEKKSRSLRGTAVRLLIMWAKVRTALGAVAMSFALTASAALAADQVHDEIQVYNGDIAEVGQWTYEQHLNFAAIGQTQPEFPHGFMSNHTLQGTPEFAYGITNWWEAGFYLPFAVSSTGDLFSNGAKIRSLFAVPDASKRDFFYGVNFELGYEMPQFAPRPWAMEIRPIIGIRHKEWEFIVNPIVDISFGTGGEADFAPAAGSRAISARIALSASNIIPISARSAISCRYLSKASNCMRSPTSR